MSPLCQTRSSCVFLILRLSDRSNMQEWAGSMHSTIDTGGTAAIPSHNRYGREKVGALAIRTHRHKPFDRQRFVSVLWLRHAQLLHLVGVWGLKGECSPPVCECLPADGNRSIFFLSISLEVFPLHSLWVCLHLRPWYFFSETTNVYKKWKTVQNSRLLR